jgi:thiosulfate/3-mercaptopyruvate sulfurtransferase
MNKDQYTYPESLVSVDWLKKHLNDANLRVVETVWGEKEYAAGHIPGAVLWDFVSDLGGTTAQADLVNPSGMANLLSSSGIDPNTAIVVYSGVNNLLATFTFWLLKLYGVANVHLLDGGQAKWLAEGGTISTETTVVPITHYTTPVMNSPYRADKDAVLMDISKGLAQFLDCRPADMFRGDNPAGIARTGHIPGALNLPAIIQTNKDGSTRGLATPFMSEDGTFKNASEMRAILEDMGVTPEHEIITYCVRGGLSTQAWFALTQLLGYPFVREYERSWEEWGNLPDTPIE